MEVEEALEEVVVDEASGRLLTDSTWTYKIPTPDLTPQQFVVSFLEDAPNPHGEDCGLMMAVAHVVWVADV